MSKTKSLQEAVDEFMAIYPEPRIQMFDIESVMKDQLVTLHQDVDGTVRYCPAWEYLEILEANPDIYEEIFKKYGY